jgi:thioesterase domain-containing protein/acyl carrier protein
LELQLVQIWEDLLKRRPVGVNEDFFDLGGDSVSAMSLLARVSQETGYNLPTAGILQARTIEKLARALREGITSEPWSPIVPVQPEGTRRPFFCVHPGGGNVLCYLGLSRWLGSDRPFYGVQCRGVDGVLEPWHSAEEMAGEYVAALRRVQPHGPYALGGWSVGGVLAYEMAQQLTAAGQRVAPLAILDSGVLYACAILTAIFPKGEMGALDLLRLPSEQQLAEFRRRSAAAQLIPDAADEELANRIFRLFTSNMRALLNYRAEPYDGRIVLFQAVESLVKKRFEPRYEWPRLCAQVEVQEVPGNHLTMIHEPHVCGLAEKLSQCLDAAQ